MLPLWYTAARNANLTGEPVAQPLWFEFPDVAEYHTLETEVLVGGALLVVPVVGSARAAVTIVTPPGRWYNFFNGSELIEDGNHFVELSEIPVYIRGGKIVPAYSRSALSTKEILATPITLHIALDADGRASGSLYLDDGETHAFLAGEYLNKRFEFADGVLTGSTIGGTIPERLTGIRVERLVFYGAERREVNVKANLAEDFVIRPDENVIQGSRSDADL
jgi:alpha-glucosidase (family GH31 glycosyl hydrolase)